MRPLQHLLLLFALLCGSLPGIAAGQGRNLGIASADRSPRVALVIGNATYPGVAALKNPANDARDMAARLSTLGFQVTLKTNVPLRDMLRTLTAFGESIQRGSEVVFYYAGHGLQVRGRNYLIPVDAEIRSENAVSSEAVDVEQLLDKLAAARLSLVILDACRNNPFEQRFRGGGQGLASINAPTGTLIAYATAPGKVASDGDGRNGLYTQELLAAMNVPGIKVEDVFKRVRANVVRKSGEAQVPWESSSLTGDFYFRPGDAAPLAPPPAPVEAESAEVVLWRSAEHGNTVGDYDAYLRRFPAGTFSELARTRIALLKPLSAPAASGDARSLDEAPRWQVGDQWRYTNFAQSVEQAGEDGFTLRLTLGDITTTTRTNREGNPVSTDTATAVGTVKATYSPYLPILRFPLKAGKTWRESYSLTTAYLFSSSHSSEYEARVAGWETVKVPAGSFDTLRIDWQIRSSGGPGNQEGSHWYSPEAKAMVKLVTRNGGKSTTVELESFSVKPD